jgi:uncharacterized integral membrane protein
VLLVFVAAVVLFCIQNFGAVSVTYLGWSVRLPLPLLVLMIYLLGMVSGWGLLSFLRRSIRLATDRRVKEQA